MKSSSDNYTKEVLGCLIWILLFVGLFYSGIGDDILKNIRPTAFGATEVSTPDREWQLVDGTALRGRVLAVDERSGEVIFESEQGGTRNKLRLDSFSPEDQMILLRRARESTSP